MRRARRSFRNRFGLSTISLHSILVTAAPLPAASWSTPLDVAPIRGHCGSRGITAERAVLVHGVEPAGDTGW
jgi:hypothetical protein